MKENNNIKFGISKKRRWANDFTRGWRGIKK